MTVTLDEINGFLNKLMDEPAGADYAARLGRKTWHLLHKAAEMYGCPTCQPGFEKLINVDHNTVNLLLGKPIVNEKLYREGMDMVLNAYKKHLEHGHQHFSENMRIGHRRVHIVSDTPEGIAHFKGTVTTH